MTTITAKGARAASAGADRIPVSQTPFDGTADGYITTDLLGAYFSKNTLATGTITTSQPMTLTQTWNAGAVTFTGFLVNINDSASATASLLADFQYSSTSLYAFKKTGLFMRQYGGDGQALLSAGSNGFGTLQIGGTSYGNSGVMAIRADSNIAIRGSSGLYAWDNGSDNPTGTLDTGLARNVAGIVESNSGGAIGTGGIVPGMRFATTQVVTTLANNNSAQNVFAAANDVLTLVASTTYFFECLYYLDTGATTHTTATGFVASSAFTSINYWAELWSTTAGTISTTAPSVLNVAASTATVLNATSTATRTTIRCSGVIRTNSASTVTPQITFSADPTGTCTVAVNSYFRIWPVGSNVVVAVGSWA